MLVFAVEFPVSEAKSLENLLDVAKAWIEGSPHRRLLKEQISAAFDSGSSPIDHGNESLCVIKTEFLDCSLAAVRYGRVEDDKQLQWSTEVVGAKRKGSFRIAVRVSCEALVLAARLPKPKKPYILRQLFASLGGGLDGSVPVSDSPAILRNGEIEHAAALLKGAGTTQLPIVYVSALPSGEYLLNPQRLAGWLSGMAHVFVEPNRMFSLRLMHEVNRQNAYGGTIGVYWPEEAGPRRYFYARQGQSPRELGEVISDEIRRALINKRPTRETTWAYVEEARSKRALDLLRAQGSTELNEYVGEFDRELAAKTKQFEEAEQEIWRLRAEVRRLEAQGMDRVGGVIQSGKESDLFTGDRAGIVVDALRSSLPNVRTGSRREHVLSDLIAANPQGPVRDEIEAELRSVLETSRSMDSQSRARLERIGFVITDEGRHYKAVFMGDGRYTFSISKTSSDHRAGKNLVSDIRGHVL